MPSPTEIVLSAQVLLEAAPDAMVVVDRLGEIVVANMQAEKLFGYTHAQLPGKSLDELLPPRYRVRHSQHREDFFGVPEIRAMGVGLKLFALRNDGTEVPVDISLSPLVIESGTFVIAAIRDVTERKRMEAALHETEERFRLAMSSVAEGLYTPPGKSRNRPYTGPVLHMDGKALSGLRSRGLRGGAALTRENFGGRMAEDGRSARDRIGASRPRRYSMRHKHGPSIYFPRVLHSRIRWLPSVIFARHCESLQCTPCKARGVNVAAHRIMPNGDGLCASCFAERYFR